MSNAEDRSQEALAAITDALCVIVKREIFWGVLVSRIRASVGGCPTAGVNQNNELKVSPDFILNLPIRERAGLILHEVGHLALDSWGRRGTRDHLIWNAATDYKINQLIEESAQWAGLPAGGLRDQKFDALSAEQVYDILNDEKQKDPKGPGRNPGDGKGDGKGGGGDDGDPGPNGGDWGYGSNYGDADFRDIPGKSQAQVSSDRTDWQTALIQAAEIARQRGNLPASIADIVKDITRPAIPWQSVLRRFIEGSVDRGDDQSYLRPGRRSFASGRLIPGDLPAPDPVVVAIDTSGSVLGCLDRFVGEVSGILRLYPHAPVRFIVVDATIHYDGETLADINEVKRHCVGGGGTDFTEVFERLGRGVRPAGLVFLTDLCAGGIPAKSPGYPVLWVLPEEYAGYSGDAPFGKVLTIPKDGGR